MLGGTSCNKSVNFDHQIEVSVFLVMSVLSRRVIFGPTVSILLSTANKRQGDSIFYNDRVIVLTGPQFLFHAISIRSII